MAKSTQIVHSPANIWSAIREDAIAVIVREPILLGIIRDEVLSHSTFEDAVAYRVASICMEQGSPEAEQLKNMFRELFDINYPQQDDLHSLAVSDLIAVCERDAACDSYLTAFLYFKGLKALQGYRIAHLLYTQNRRDLALLLQSRCSQVYGVDIHPAARIGKGLLIDHGTGVVIGETAVLGKNCSILHNVTLGSTGKDKQDRHPKIGDDVLIGCNASVLGNIRIGDNCKIGAGSIVLKPLSSQVTAVGNPARVVGLSKDTHAGIAMDQGLYHVEASAGGLYLDTWEI